MNKTVLIIGANSALARDVMPVLAREHTLITAGKKGCDIYCDITESFTVPDGVDVVINFAANFGGVSDEEILAAVQTNIVGALNVCQAAKKAGVQHVVNISSIFTLLDESSSSYSIYALTKKHADELTSFYCKLHQLPLTILRPSRIYGDTDAFEKNQPFLYQMVHKAQDGEEITIYGNHDPSRNYIHSADLAEIIHRVIAQETEGVYSCTYPVNSSYSQIARAAQAVFGHEGTVTFLRDRPDIPDDTFPLDQSLYDSIAYRPNISVEAGIQRIKEYREGK